MRGTRWSPPTSASSRLPRPQHRPASFGVGILSAGVGQTNHKETQQLSTSGRQPLGWWRSPRGRERRRDPLAWAATGHLAVEHLSAINTRVSHRRRTCSWRPTSQC